MGLSLLLNADEPKEVNLMVSHSWDENAACFFEDIEKEARPHEVLFICFFALYQNEDGFGPTIALQLGSDIHQGPFAEVINRLKPQGWLARNTCGYFGRSRGRMLVVTNRECAVYSRLWCVWEAYVAAANLVPTHFTDPELLFDAGVKSSRHARCSNADDEARIRDAILKIPVETRRDRNVVVAFFAFFYALPVGSLTVSMGLSIAALVTWGSARRLADPTGRLRIAKGLGLAAAILEGTAFLLGTLVFKNMAVLREHSRRLSQKLIKGDGYDRLDEVVNEAAEAAKAHRRRERRQQAKERQRSDRALAIVPLRQRSASKERQSRSGGASEAGS